MHIPLVQTWPDDVYLKPLSLIIKSPLPTCGVNLSIHQGKTCVPARRQTRPTPDTTAHSLIISLIIRQINPCYIIVSTKTHGDGVCVRGYSGQLLSGYCLYLSIWNGSCFSFNLLQVFSISVLQGLSKVKSVGPFFLHIGLWHLFCFSCHIIIVIL